MHSKDFLNTVLTLLVLQPLYNGSGTGGGRLIEVHVNKLYDTQSSVFVGRDPGEKSDMSLMQRRKGPVKCLPCTALLAERYNIHG